MAESFTAREKKNSNTLYVLGVEVLPMKKKMSQSATSLSGSRSKETSSMITIPDLIRDVKIYNYDTQENQTYTQENIKFSFIGEKALNKNNKSLEKAKEMESAGKTSEDIRKNTGWFRGGDNKWRFEIDSSKMRVDHRGKFHRNSAIRRRWELFDKLHVTNTATKADFQELMQLDRTLGTLTEPKKLGDLIDYPQLFEAYPQLADMDFSFVNLGDMDGGYSPLVNKIFIDESLKEDSQQMRQTLIHEIQHAIQEAEGFAKGSNLIGLNKAIEEAKRCIQCHCDECMKSCVYLREYKKHPGLLAREIYNNTQIIMGDHQMNKPMNSCSLCGQCTVTCPNGFDMSQVCKSARENMVSTDKMPLAPHEFALMDMLFSNSEAFLCRPQPGYETCRYVFFPGCQAGAIAPDVVTEAYEDLCRRTEGGVALMLGCCGAISEWAGRYEMTEKVNEQLKQELAKLGDPMIIAGCPSCMKQLKESLGAKVTGIWEILKEIGLPGQAKGLEIPVAIHDACGARGDTQTQNTIRELLADMGCTVVNTEYSRDRSPCCGYGGLTAYANKEMADKMTEKCLERSDSPYITYCMACRDRFVREGRESRHILELLYGINAANMPDISEKRYNRLELKEKLLKNIWNEELMMEKKDYTVAYTEDAISMMDERMILKSDVERVLSDYRENQEAIFDEETKELVTRSRLGNVTFWVRFVETEEGYLVRRAYSHRMNIMKRVGQ